MWTGDNSATYDDVPLALNMMMSLGISGIIHSGADVPGFIGVPEDDLFV